LRFGKQLHNIIDNAINGEDADEFGIKVFDLSPQGVNLKIKVDEQGGYANYTASRFTSASDLKLSTEQIDKIYESTVDLKGVLTVRPYDELKKMLDEHYHASNRVPDKTETTSFASAPAANNFTTVAESEPWSSPTSDAPAFEDDEHIRMKALLEGL
jgi:hypothetical protein